jgi:hypothetical protein
MLESAESQEKQSIDASQHFWGQLYTCKFPSLVHTRFDLYSIIYVNGLSPKPRPKRQNPIPTEFQSLTYKQQG